MDIVIPWLAAWAYPLVGVGTTFYAARSYRRKNPRDDSGLAAGAGLLSGAGWPIGLLYWFTINLLHKEEQQKQAESRQEMTLETAHQVIARHEAKLAADRQARNRRLHDDWDKLARLAAKPAKDEPVWQRSLRKITDFNN